MRSFGGPDGAGSGEAGGQTPQEKLAQWVERLLKIHSTEQRALHDEVAELLTYSVQAAETEQATQNIAIETLKLGQPYRRGARGPRRCRDRGDPRREQAAVGDRVVAADLAADPVAR